MPRKTGTQSSRIIYPNYTVKSSFALSGIGIHSGKRCDLEFIPAPIGAGIFFEIAGNKIPASLQYAGLNHFRSTLLEKEGIQLSTTEHVLAACAALRVSNLCIRCSSTEMPIFDGSAIEFYKALKTNLIEQEGVQQHLIVQEPFSFTVDPSDKYFKVYPYKGFKVTYILDYETHPKIGLSTFSQALEDNALELWMSSRTFGFLKEYEALKQQNKALGANYNNCIVINDTDFEVPLRHPKELAAHKALDLLGDLKLLQMNLSAHILAYKTGHSENIQLGKHIQEKFLD